MFTLQEFMATQEIPEHSKGIINNLYRYFSTRKSLVVNMLDEKDGLPLDASGKIPTSQTLEVLTGIEPDKIQYSKLGEVNLDKYSLISFTGKARKFCDYEEDKDFDRFEPVIKIIRETSVPIIALCAGHQLVGKAYGGKIEMVGIDPGTGSEIKINGWLNPYQDSHGILTLDHPLFSEYLKTDRTIHHKHAEHVSGMDDRVAVLAESIAPNDKYMAYVLELKDPKKHIIGFQNHPERNPHSNLSKGEKPHYSGLVFLVSALDLLTVNSQKYTETKQRLYLSR